MYLYLILSYQHMSLMVGRMQAAMGYHRDVKEAISSLTR